MPIVDFATIDNPISEIISTDQCCETAVETITCIPCSSVFLFTTKDLEETDDSDVEIELKIRND